MIIFAIMNSSCGKTFEIRPYTPSQAEEWNLFVRQSRNGTFLFDRGYMDYHADRFADCSLMVRHNNGKLAAVLPANRVEATLYSHQGLTFGGLVMCHELGTADVLDIFQSLNGYLKTIGVQKVIYKPVPWIYSMEPSEEDLFALHHACGATLVSRQAAAVLTMHRPRFEESRRSGIRKARRADVTVGQSNDVDAFWNMLNNNLQNKYNSRPVHTLEEMRLLMSRFPLNIKLFMAFVGGKPVAGTVVYESSQVAHTQYIAATDEGKAVGATDLLFEYLLVSVYPDKPCFDFGTSLTSGREFNPRLAFQKEGFGARAVCYDCYEWSPLQTQQTHPSPCPSPKGEGCI